MTKTPLQRIKELRKAMLKGKKATYDSPDNKLLRELASETGPRFKVILDGDEK